MRAARDPERSFRDRASVPPPRRRRHSFLQARRHVDPFSVACRAKVQSQDLTPRPDPFDASVVVKLVLKGESHRITARRLGRESIAAGIDLIAPPIFTTEVDSVIRKRVHDGRLNQADAQRAYAVLDRAPVQVTVHPSLRQRAREIAEQFNQRTVYDASYAALAELHRCEFWTADKVFHDAVKTTLSFVKYPPDYP